MSTGYSDHFVRVFSELWDGPPEPATTGQPREAEFFATCGRVRLTELVSRDDHVVFDLGRRAASWKLRLILYELQDPDEIGVVNSSSELEQYRFQFWPSPD